MSHHRNLLQRCLVYTNTISCRTVLFLVNSCSIFFNKMYHFLTLVVRDSSGLNIMKCPNTVIKAE